MKFFNKKFVLIFLFLFSIPFISCNNNSTEPDEKGIPEGSEWVMLPSLYSDLNCEEWRAYSLFPEQAKAACKRKGMKYLGKSRCVDYGNGIEVTEILCGK